MHSPGLKLVVSLLLVCVLLTGSLAAGKPIWTAPGGPPVAISADGGSVLSGGEPARLYQGNGTELWAGHAADAVAITRDGTGAFIGDTAGVRSINGSLGILWSNFDLGPVEDISLSPDEDYLASVAVDCVTVFRANGTLVWRWCYPGTHSAATSRNARRTAAGTIDSVVALNSRGDELWRYPAPGVEKVAIIPPASDIIAVSGYTLLSLNQTGDLTWSYLTDNSIRDLGVSPDGTAIVAGNQAGNLYLFNKTGSLLWKRNLGNWINTVAMSQDGSHIAAGGLGGKIHLLDGSGYILWEYATSSPVNGIAMSSDGSFLVAATGDGNISYFDLRESRVPIVPGTVTKPAVVPNLSPEESPPQTTPPQGPGASREIPPSPQAPVAVTTTRERLAGGSLSPILGLLLVIMIRGGKRIPGTR